MAKKDFREQARKSLIDLLTEFVPDFLQKEEFTDRLVAMTEKWLMASRKDRAQLLEKEGRKMRKWMRSVIKKKKSR